MNIIGFCGSPHKRGNTYLLLRHCLDTLEKDGVKTELIQVGGSGIFPCKGCDSCRKTGLLACANTLDHFNEWYSKIIRSDGFILATPTYCWAPTPELKSLVDRLVYISRGSLRAGATSNPLRRKVGAAIAVDGVTGAPQAIQALQTVFTTTQMIVPGAAYWPAAKGLTAGEVLEDKLGLGYVEDLAHNMSWLLKKIVTEKS